MHLFNIQKDGEQKWQSSKMKKVYDIVFWVIPSLSIIFILLVTLGVFGKDQSQNFIDGSINSFIGGYAPHFSALILVIVVFIYVKITRTNK